MGLPEHVKAPCSRGKELREGVDVLFEDGTRREWTPQERVLYERRSFSSFLMLVACLVLFVLSNPRFSAPLEISAIGPFLLGIKACMWIILAVCSRSLLVPVMVNGVSVYLARTLPDEAIVPGAICLAIAFEVLRRSFPEGPSIGL